MTAPVFHLAALDPAASVLELRGPEGRHAAAVRRIGPGEQVDVTDGSGTVAHCTVTRAEREALVLAVDAVVRFPPPQPALVVVQALAKGDRGELAVELLTEVGADEVVPWSASRSVVEWRGERGERALARWRSTAREAAKQSRRAWWPDVTGVATTAEVASRLADATLGVVLHESAGRPLAELAVPADGEVVVVVGPEGGVTDVELEGFASVGALACRLGPTVLRTSTAGVVAAGLLLSRTPRWSALT